MEIFIDIDGNMHMIKREEYIARIYSVLQTTDCNTIDAEKIFNIAMKILDNEAQAKLKFSNKLVDICIITAMRYLSLNDLAVIYIFPNIDNSTAKLALISNEDIDKIVG